MSKVLIIEDEKAMSDLIAIKFKVEGFEVDQAFSLAEAKVKLTTAGLIYDAILSDYLLPDGNSLDLFTELRPQPQVAKVPIVLATNYVEDLSQDKAKGLGISEVIVKYQVVPAQMVEKVKALIKPSAGEASPVPAPAAASAPAVPVTTPAPVTPAIPVTPVSTPPAAAPQVPQPVGQFQATMPGTAPAVPPVAPVAPVVTPAAPIPVAPVPEPTPAPQAAPVSVPATPAVPVDPTEPQ